MLYRTEPRNAEVLKRDLVQEGKNRNTKEMISPEGKAAHNILSSSNHKILQEWVGEDDVVEATLALQIQSQREHPQCRWWQQFEIIKRSICRTRTQTYISIHTNTCNFIFPEWSVHYYTLIYRFSAYFFTYFKLHLQLLTPKSITTHSSQTFHSLEAAHKLEAHVDVRNKLIYYSLDPHLNNQPLLCFRNETEIIQGMLQ